MFGCSLRIYGSSGYSGLINYYIEKGHAPQMLKVIMSFMANHANVAGPMQGVTEITFGVLLLIGLLTRPVALAAFLFLSTLWILKVAGRCGFAEFHCSAVTDSQP